MQRLATPEVKQGPEQFWSGVRYFYHEPQVGLVVVRNLLDEDQVAEIAVAGRVGDAWKVAGYPNGRRVRTAVETALMARSVSTDLLDMFNWMNWNPKNPKLASNPNDSFVVTPYGQSLQAHCDDLKNPFKRPIGVAMSISIGRTSCFAAALPPENVRIANGASFQEYEQWRKGALATTQTLHKAILEPGDAALWLQPGMHEAFTNDADRFGCIFSSTAIHEPRIESAMIDESAKI